MNCEAVLVTWYTAWLVQGVKCEAVLVTWYCIACTGCNLWSCIGNMVLHGLYRMWFVKLYEISWQTTQLQALGCTVFLCGSMVKQDRYHILYFLHFTDTRTGVHRRDKNCDRMEKVWDLSEILNRIFSKFYDFHRQLAVDRVTAPFNGRAVLEQCIRKKPEHVSINIYKLCNSIRHWSVLNDSTQLNSWQ